MNASLSDLSSHSSDPNVARIARLHVVYLAIADLRPHPSNARTHSKKQIKQIAASMRTFGFTNPVLIDRKSTIVCGHGRVEAAKILGMAEVPTIRLEELSEDQVRAYLIADNEIASKAGWDHEILAIELQHLMTLDASFDITVTGFEMPEIDLIIEGSRKKPEQDPDDAVVRVAALPVSKLGDLWLMGPHRLLCGNALESASFEQLMDGRKAVIAVEDFPYNVPVDGHCGGLGKTHHPDFAMASGEMSPEEFTSFLTRCCRHLANHSKDGALGYFFMDFRHIGELMAGASASYQQLLNLCVWSKDNGGMGSMYRSQHELVFVYKKGKASHTNNVQLGKYGRNRTNVWAYPGLNQFARKDEDGFDSRLHPTLKPVALVADILLDASVQGDIVLDSFLGSGTTLIAAQRVGRVCCGMELEPRYVDVAVRRWQRYTGERAVHAVTGLSFDEVAAAVESAAKAEGTERESASELTDSAATCVMEVTHG